MTLIQRIRAALDPFCDSGYLPGYVAAVRHRGRVTVVAAGLADVERGIPMGSKTQFRLASLTKPVGAVLVLQLIEEKVLGLDDPLAEFLPEFADLRVLRSIDAPLEDTVALERPITIRHLLTMSSGIGYQVGTPLGDAQVARGLRAARLQHVPRQPEVDWAEMLTLPLAFQPGEGWAYEWSAEILTRVVTSVCATGLAELVSSRIAGPLGLDHLGYRGDAARLAAYYADEPGSGLRLVDPGDGLAATTGLRPSLSHGLIATPTDYLSILADLCSTTPRLLSPAMARQMRSPQITPAVASSGRAYLGAGSYGYGVAVQTSAVPNRGGIGRFGWTGITGVQAYADPTHDLVAGIFTQRGSDDSMRLACFGPFWDAVHAHPS